MNTEILLTPKEADVLAHTSQNGRYVTDEVGVIAMAESGMLHDHGPQALAGGMHYLVMTSAGRAALNAWRAAQPKPKPISKRRQRAKERYHRFREYGDGFPNFREFLKWDRQLERSWNQ